MMLAVILPHSKFGKHCYVGHSPPNVSETIQLQFAHYISLFLCNFYHIMSSINLIVQTLQIFIHM